MTLDGLERQNRGFYGFFSRYWAAQVFIIHKVAPPSPTPHAPMCIMVPMGRVQVICDFRNYNYWTGNAIGFHASCELCSNFLFISGLPTDILDSYYQTVLWIWQFDTGNVLLNLIYHLFARLRKCGTAELSISQLRCACMICVGIFWGLFGSRYPLVGIK